MNTEMFKKGGVVARNANRAGHGLSATAIVFLYMHFVTKGELREHCRQCERANDKIEQRVSETWQKTMDHEVTLARRGIVEVEFTNSYAVNQTKKGKQ